MASELRRKQQFRGSSMVERLPVKEMVPGSSPGRGGGHSGVFRPASVLNSIKIPDVLWDFDFCNSVSESIFCLILAYRQQVSNRSSLGNLLGSK